MRDILNRIQSQSKNRFLTVNDLPRIHSDFMIVYGWIPFAEFKKLPSSRLWELYKEVQRELGKREMFMVGMMRGAGYKNFKFEDG